MKCSSRHKYPFFLLILIFTLRFTSANAALVDNGLYTTDTITGIDWLDLTETNGKSFDEVSNQLNNGEKLEGWKFATRSDIDIFWTDAGGVGPFSGLANGKSNWVGQIQRLWGKTYPFVYLVNGYAVQGSIAMTSDKSGTCSTCNLTVYILDNIDLSDSNYGDYAEAIQLNEAYRSQGQVPIGMALIRNNSAPIPEPATLSMYALGLVAVLSLVKRSRKSI
jgi:hypothetical protein